MNPVAVWLFAFALVCIGLGVLTAADHIIRELRARRVSRYRHDQPLTIHNIWRHH